MHFDFNLAVAVNNWVRIALVVGVNQVEHVYELSSLAEAFDPSQSLLNPRWVPQKIVVDQLRERIEMVPRIS